MKLFEQAKSLLSFPEAYRLLMRALGGEKSTTIYLAEYVKPSCGERVLDLGCGPADMLSFLGDVTYTGLDVSPEYIAAAKRRFGTRGRFWCADVGLASLEQERSQFDLVLATGVLHHLDDERACSLFDLAHLALRPGGRLITLDGCYVPEQSSIARWMLDKDRGKFIRPRSEYTRLAARRFPELESFVRHDLLRTPYTHLIMRCRK